VRLGVERALVDGELLPGDVAVDDGVISGVGLSPAGRSGLAAPGFVDLQVNGFAGVDFLTTDDAGYAHAGEALARHGVTSYQPTFITSSTDVYLRALELVGSLEHGRGPRVLGVHLEGPFISPRWPGAHNPDNIVDPDSDLADRLLAAGPVSYMTIAPERPGGIDLVASLRRRGVVVAIGHSDADAQTAHAAFDAGATAITHIYNAQRRWQPRDPGLAGAALARPEVCVQAIVDNVHLAAETISATFRATRTRFALVTDAMEAAGLPPGDYKIGDRAVHVEGGAVRLDDGTLAGSVLTMDAAVRNLVSLGAPLIDALESSSLVPARLVDRPELGTLAPGTPADVVVLDDHLEVLGTYVAGHEVPSARN
jgi:N-acetylglucosamine-6-phosphate deacetylase